MRKRNWNKHLTLAAGFACSLLMAGPSFASSNGDALNSNSSNPLTFAVYGDSPYGTTPTDHAEFDASPAFIDTINSDPQVRLVIHVGDIHSGKQYCTQAYDQSIYDLWALFKNPLVYTPGDNEWTDCNKAGEGGGSYNKVTKQIDYVLDANGNPVDYASGNPVANLDLIRQIFFSDPGYSLGGQKKRLISQAQYFDTNYPSDAKYVENVMWEQSKVLFVTINLPGGSNNDKDVWYGAPTETAAQKQERDERNGADIRWLNAAFAQAKADGMEAVVIAAQADMWDPEKGAAHQAGYENIVSTIAAGTIDFGKPVLMFNGDSHVYQSGNPFASIPVMTSPTSIVSWYMEVRSPWNGYGSRLRRA